MQLIVCATIMGRAASLTSDDNWRSHEQSYPNSDSHVVNEFEYIVFHASQILPCHVIHLDWGLMEARRVLEHVPNNPSFWFKAQARKRNTTHPKLGREILCPGDQVRLQAVKQVAAARWFRFGYGPPKGTSFKIEEISEVSDDEENHGSCEKDVMGKWEYSKEVEYRDHRGHIGLTNTIWNEPHNVISKCIETELKTDLENFARDQSVASDHSCDEHS
jgi:hypothetical protein